MIEAIIIEESYNSLQCPKCGDSYLCHDKVEVWVREEDSATGQHIKINRNSLASIDGDMSDCMGRRHGMSIYFECEVCHAGELKLNIYQHKGQTIVEWT